MYTFMLFCCCKSSPLTSFCVLVWLIFGSATNAAFLAEQTPELAALPRKQLAVCPTGGHVKTPSINRLDSPGQLSVEMTLTDETFQAVLAASMKLQGQKGCCLPGICPITGWLFFPLGGKHG